MKPNQVLLTTTLEYVAMPDNACAEVFINSYFECRNILFHTEIEPGYRGCIPIELINRGNVPVELVVGDKLLHITIEKLEKDTKCHGVKNKHFAQIRPELHRLSNNTTLAQLQECI